MVQARSPSCAYKPRASCSTAPTAFHSSRKKAPVRACSTVCKNLFILQTLHSWSLSLLSLATVNLGQLDGLPGSAYKDPKTLRLACDGAIQDSIEKRMTGACVRTLSCRSWGRLQIKRQGAHLVWLCSKCVNLTPYEHTGKH